MDTQAGTGTTEIRRTTTYMRKRKLTDDRRRQNREAQRRYRERRKNPRSPSDPRDDAQEIGGLLNEAKTNGRELTFAPSQVGFPDCLFQPIDDNIFADPTFLSDMLLLESSSREPDHTSLDAPWPLSLPDSPPSRQEHAPSRSSNNVVIDTTSPLPSPYKNHLTIQKLSFYAARIQNALHLGLPAFLAQKEDDISPWYWHTQFSLLISPDPFAHATPRASVSPYEFAVNRPVRKQPCFIMSSTINPDLSPTPLQRTHAHGLYLDVIPFPIFRDRAITLLSMTPPAFDEKELKRDMENEGLMVWGAGHGSTKRVASLVRDKRNWECAKWFYQKWRLLVEGSGLEEQSRWWRSMRGEEESDEE